MEYISTEKLKAEIEKRKQIHFDDYFIKESGNPADYGASNALAQVLSLIDSLQQEPTPDTDVLHEELVNLLKTYRIGEDTARTMADRIADTYGAQRYIDGLCDGLDEKDTKQEQPEVSHWKPTEEQIGALNYAYCELFKREDVGHNILGPLQELCDELRKL
jgi:hypothetical protein